MKAVYLLICLGLARDISGSIFHRQHSRRLERFGEPQDYIDPYYYQQQVQYPQKTVDYQPQLVKHVTFKVADTSSEDVRSTETRSHEKILDDLSRVNGGLYVPRYADKTKTPMYMVKNFARNPTEANGDTVQWRGIEIAVGPNTPVEKREEIESIYRDAQMAMNHVTEETKKKFHDDYLAIPEEKLEDAYLNATDLLKKNKYPVEEHVVKTEDGYYLTMFRILKQMDGKTDEMTPRPVVLLMHGLLGSADDWLVMGPSHSLAYLLADEGFDVWLGNCRGSKYSRLHVSKHPAQSDFWLFNNDDIALLDLPAMIDYALRISGQPRLYYIGYSQGTTNFFALASTRPEYDKVVKMYALSPMAYMTNVRSPLVRMIAPNSKFYENLDQQLGSGEFKPSKELINIMGGEMCQTEIGCDNVCSNVNFVMSGVNMENIDVTHIRIVMGHLPAGGSTRQIKQYGQWVASDEFRMYDYGSEINQKVYGTIQPPVYDVTKIKTPVALYYSEEDWLAHPKDVEKLKQQLPNVTDYYEVPVEHFTNMDYVFSKKAPEVIYKRLIDSIKNYVKQ